MALLTCPTCGTPFPPSHVNVSVGVASCEPCGQVHDLRRGRSVDRTAPDPQGFTVVDGASSVVSYSWRGLVLVFLVIWCTFWDGMLLLMGSVAVAKGEWESLGYLAVHFVAGVVVTYYTVAVALNRTDLRVAGGEVSVRHGPLPWFGDRVLSGRDIQQVYVVEHRGSKGGLSYSVHARVVPGHEVRLVGGLPVGRARFLEDWLEQKLGLVDAPVAGEHR